MNKEITKTNIIEKKIFILEIGKINKNFRKYTKEVVQSWIDKMDDYGYEVEFGVFMKPSEIQYEFIKNEIVCGLVTELLIENGILYGIVKFSTDGYKSDDIYSGKLNIDECVIVPKGKAEVRESVVQNNYELFGFNLVHKSQSSFYYE